MAKSSLVRFTSFAALLALASCAAPTGPAGEPGTGGSNATAGTNGAAGTTGSGGSNAGSNGTAGTTGAAGTTGSGGSNGGSTGATGGAVATAGTGGSSSTAGRGGSSATAGTGGSSSTAGTGGSSSTAGRGGSSSTAGTGGSSSTAGTGGSTTGTGGTGIRMDQNGKQLAKAGDQATASRDYLYLGDMRLINNRWGSDELGCTGTQQRVYINSDKSLGMDFNRPVCGGAKAKPDYPEVEFGVAPFGAGNSLLTTPSFSTTTLLPIQLKNMTSGTVKVESMVISLQKPTIWNMNFEMWFSQQNPATSTNPGVYAEIIVFWGWETGRWPCQAAELSKPPVTAGNNTYQLCHQSDTWGSGWRFYQFNVTNGPLTTYNGTVDAKALANWVVSNYGLSQELWVTRFEIGSEIDDNTQGKVTIKNLTFSVNGTSKSPEFQ